MAGKAYFNNNQSVIAFYNGQFITKGYFNNEKTLFSSDLVTLTINPTPSDAEVSFSNYGVGQISNDGKSITIRKGQSVTYTVSKIDYITQNNTITINNNQSLNIILIEKTEYSLSYPDNANIILYNFEGEFVQDPDYKPTLVRLDITIPRSFTLYLTNVNRSASSTNFLKDGTYTCFLDRNIEVRIYSTYKTGSIIKVTHTYNHRFILSEDTSLTITNNDYS